MLNAKGLVLASAVFLASVMPVAAQEGLGVGLSFHDDGVGTGVLLDYSKALQNQPTSTHLGWVGEFGYFPGDYNLLYLQGGVRASGPAGNNGKLNWLGHGLLGLAHASVDGVDEICDILDVECDASDNSFVLTIGGGVEYTLSPTSGLRGQIDFPIIFDDGSSTSTRFTVSYVWKPKK